MPVRERIREVKHLRNHYFICVLEYPENIVNIATAIRNISAFGVENYMLLVEIRIFYRTLKLQEIISVLQI